MRKCYVIRANYKTKETSRSRFAGKRNGFDRKTRFFANRPKSSREDPQEVNQAILGDFKIQEDVKMHSQLLGYDDFGVLFLESESDLAAISKRLCEVSPNPSRLTLKRHLFSANMPTKLLNPVGGISLCGKKDEFQKERLFRREDMIQIPKKTKRKKFCLPL